jgi:threonine/homoserine/homoserine lactone efflux protein
MLWNAVGEVLAQAVGIAISPIPVVLLILVLVSAQARSNGLAFAVGWTLGVVAVAAVAFTLSESADVSGDTGAAAGGNVLQIGLGLLFAALAVRQWRQRPRPGVEPARPKIFGAMDSMPTGKIFGLAFAAAAANPKNLPLAISGGVGIAQTGASAGQGLTAVVIFALVASSTVLIPVGAVLLLGDRTRRPLDDLKTWLLANNSAIMIVLFTVLAAKMFGSGLDLTN